MKSFLFISLVFLLFPSSVRSQTRIIDEIDGQPVSAASIFDAVTNFPSLPTNGEELVPKVI